MRRKQVMARQKVREKVFNMLVVKERCILSRHRAGYTRKQAAEAMGYAGTAEISKMESATSNTGVNMEYLIRAAMAYGVSLDYLCGLSNYPERDLKSVEQIAIYNSVKAYIDQASHFFLTHILQNVGHIDFKLQAEKASDAIQEIAKSVARIRELNPDFDEEIRGSARLVDLVENSYQLSEKIKQQARRADFSDKSLNDGFDEVLKEHLQQDLFDEG